MNNNKPLSTPHLNCYVILPKDEAKKKIYYWLYLGMRRSKSFHPYLRGSVIPFIVISDYAATIKEDANRANANLAEFE